MRTVLFLGCFLLTLALDARSLSYEQIDVAMKLHRDTSINVVETQHVRMDGKWNGLYRDYDPRGADAIEINALYEKEHAYQRGNLNRKGGYVVERSDEGILKLKWRSLEKSESANDLRTEFAQVLPWAVALGVVDQSVAYYGQRGDLHAPYYHHNHFGHHPISSGQSPAFDSSSIGSFSESLSSLSSTVRSSLSSSPSSSGSGGGGSSGGGGGGGGGW